MGRVEETNKASTELENTLANCINNATTKDTVIAMILTAQCSVNTEIAKSLAQLADDLRYFRKKDEEEAAVEEEAKCTCKDCTLYKRLAGTDPNTLIHWCGLYYCSMSEDSLKHPCKSFERR
jgi:hypothetical protein